MHSPGRKGPLAIIGLGYVGLPLAVEFGKHRPTLGFDINPERIRELEEGCDRTREVDAHALQAAQHLRYTAQAEDLREARIFIITVPTPIDASRQPDLKPLLAASRTVGQVLKPGDLVIYESTVYPGCTEEACVPLLEAESGLAFNEDFYCGYSPERINPGDKVHTVTQIRKVTAGSTPEVAREVDALYASIIEAGTYMASSIKVAEAAKVIENAQRDLNIAFVNELALIFDRMSIDTTEVLEAAGTKWNFLPFRPGLVGGHCIGVDPYYLTYKAEQLGYHPEVVLAGRRINDNMGRYIAQKVVKMMIHRGHRIFNARALMLGITFKENCPDIRNSRAIDVVRELQDFGIQVDVVDPWADSGEVHQEYGLALLAQPEGRYDAVILTVAHQQFQEMDWNTLCREDTVRYDVKAFLGKEQFPVRL